MSVGKITSIVALALFFSACSVRHAPLPENRRPVETSPPVPAGESLPLSSEDQALVNSFDLSAAKERRLSASSVAVTVNQTLKPLATILFSKEVLGNRAITSSQEFFRLIVEFNLNFVAVNKQSPKALVASGLTNQYKDILFADCDDRLKGTCANLKIFARDVANLGSVLMLMAHHEADVAQYYRLLNAAQDFAGMQLNQELSFMYLDRYQEYIKSVLPVSLNSIKDLEPSDLTVAQQEQLKDFRRILQNVMRTFDPSKAKESDKNWVLKNFNPWDVSRRTSSVSMVGIEQVLKWAGQGALYEDAQKHTLNPAFKSRVEQILNNSNAAYGLGLNTIVNYITKSRSGRILKNFNLVHSFTPNEYLYLIDRLYYGHFTLDDALAMWSQTSKNKEALFEAINTFVRLQIAYMIVWTNSEMNTFFEKSATQYGTDFIKLLQGAVTNGLRFHAAWSHTLSLIEGIAQFVDRQYGKTDLHRLDDSDPYKQFVNATTSLKNNVKMLSVYPNMMMFAYLMAKKNFSATIMTFWGPIDITAASVIKSFFIDVMSPWFNFGTDNIKITQPELLYALHFALMTETVANFKSNPVLAVNEIGFLTEIAEKLTVEPFNRLNDSLSSLVTYEKANENLLREAMNACQVERVAQPAEDSEASQNQGSFKLRTRNYVRSFSFADLNERLSNGFPRPFDNPMGAFVRFYDNLDLPRNLNELRTETEARFLYVRNMKDIIRNYLVEVGADTTEFDKKYQEQIERFESKRNQYVRSIYRLVRQFGDCDQLLFKYEQKLRDYTLESEAQYLGSIFDRLNELNAAAQQGSPNTADLLLLFNKSIGPTDSDLPKSYVDQGGYDRFVRTADGSFYFNYHQFDALLRLRRNLKVVAPNTMITLPSIDKLPYYQSPIPYSLVPETTGSLEQQRAAFINDGMRRFVGFRIPKEIFTTGYLIDKLELYAQLYRFGPISENGAPNCLGENCLHVSAEEVIKLALSIIKQADMRPMDEKFLNWTGDQEIHPEEYWKALTIEGGTRRHLGLLDLTYLRIASDSYTTEQLPTGAGSMFLKMAQSYYERERSVGNFFFAPRENVKQTVKSQYQGYVTAFESRVKVFMEAYENVRKDPQYEVSQVRMKLNDTLRVPYESVDGRKRPLYVTSEPLAKYQAVINDFHAGTNFEFKVKAH